MILAHYIKYLKTVALYLLTIVIPLHGKAQNSLLKNKSDCLILKTSFSHLYNFNFKEAQNIISPLKGIHANEPIILLFDCLYLYWKYYPLNTHPVQNNIYKQQLEKALSITEKLANKYEDPENKFYLLLLTTMQAKQKFDDNHLISASMNIYNAYGLMKEGFTLQNKFPEFYFTTGLYKYYREFYGNEYGPILNFF